MPGEVCKVPLITSKEKHLRLAFHPNYVRRKIANEDLVIVQRSRAVLLLYKPIYCRIAKLKASKRLMFDIHYRFMMEKFGPEYGKLCSTDTDSLLYHINA